MRGERGAFDRGCLVIGPKAFEVLVGAPVVLARINPCDGNRWWRAVVRFEPDRGVAGVVQVIETAARVTCEGSDHGGLVRVFGLETSECPELPARAWLAANGTNLCVMAACSGAIALRCWLESFGMVPTGSASDDQLRTTLQ